MTHTGLDLTFGTTYYFSAFAENGAGLYSDIISSNGQLLLIPTAPPVAYFNVYSTYVCETDSIQFENASTDAVTFDWAIPGAIPPTSTDVNPYFFFPVSGTYEVTLTATGPGGVDTYVQSLLVESYGLLTSTFSPSLTLTTLDDPFIVFSNSSTNANGYLWDFGDGYTSTDFEPWHEYTAVGIYNVMLIAINGTCPNDTSWQTVEVTESLSIIEEHDNEVRIFPNPVEDAFYIQLGNQWLEKEVRLDILDSRGRILYTRSFDQMQKQHTIEIDSRFESGIYLIRLKSDSLTHEQKILVKK